MTRRTGRAGPSRILPNFFIIGAAKSGSTTLASLLSAHQDVYIPKTKETYYFLDSHLYAKGLSYYSKSFFRRAGSAVARGDVTPSYLYSTTVADRIAADLPETSHRFIVILRDPVKQVYSNYWHMVRAGAEPESFEVAIERTVERVPLGFQWIPCAADYIGAARYGQHLTRWQEIFPSDRFHVLLLEDLVHDPARELARLTEFLDIPPPLIPPHLPKDNVGSTGGLGPLSIAHRLPSRVRQRIGRMVPHAIGRRALLALGRLDLGTNPYPALLPQNAQRIRQLLADDLVLLERLIGRDLPEWRSSDSGVDHPSLRSVDPLGSAEHHQGNG